MCGCQSFHILGQQCDVGRLKRDFRTSGSHGNADISTRQCCGIVYTITNEGNLSPLGYLADKADFVLRQHLGIDFVWL